MQQLPIDNLSQTKIPQPPPHLCNLLPYFLTCGNKMLDFHLDGQKRRPLGPGFNSTFRNLIALFGGSELP